VDVTASWSEKLINFSLVVMSRFDLSFLELSTGLSVGVGVVVVVVSDASAIV